MSRLSWLTANAWPDEDGRHYWLRHECMNDEVVETMLPTIWKHDGSGHLTPSVHCTACGMHTFVPIGAEISIPQLPTKGNQ